jgi:putative hydrolase of the HAD superfamily
VIKAVFFDFDGVLTLDKTGSLTTTRYLSQATGLEHAQVKAAFTRHNEDLTLGRCTHADLWGAICHDLGVKLDIALLSEAFTSTPLNNAMLALARQLRPSYVVGIITDNKQDRIACIERLHSLSELFDPIVVSASVGSSKSDRRIFSKALALACVRPSECVFIDNNAQNLVAPREMGIDGVYFDDEANDLPRLSRELLERGVAGGDA